MTNAEFWRKRKDEFRQLSEYEYQAAPDPADRRRLYAYGNYTVRDCGKGGSWTLVGGITADFRTAFEEAAATAGCALEASSGGKAVQFWLDSLARFLASQEEGVDERGHLAVWEPDRRGVIRDLPAASAFYCSWLIKEGVGEEAAASQEENRPPRAVSRRATSKAAVETVRQLARQMIAEGASHRDVCQRLGNAPRPPHAEWRHLPWDKAYKEQQFRRSVCKWLSTNCRP